MASDPSPVLDARCSSNFLVFPFSEKNLPTKQKQQNNFNLKVLKEHLFLPLWPRMWLILLDI